MTTLEKIWYTWIILAVVAALIGWVFVEEDEHPRLLNVMAVFIWLPIAIALVAMLIWAIVQVWI